MLFNIHSIPGQDMPVTSLGYADGGSQDEINVCLDCENLDPNLKLSFDISDLEDDLFKVLLMRKLHRFSKSIKGDEILLSLIENYCPMTVDALLEKSFAKTDYLNLDKILEQNFIETVEEAKAA